MDLSLPSPIQRIELPIFNQHHVSVYIKRDDLIHQAISGNKWRKLKFNIEKYKQGKYKAILTFGGAYSNHIAATAFIGKMLNIPTIGIIRGDELNSSSNQTLTEAENCGMKLDFISREKYKERYEKLFWEELRVTYGHIYIIEEGGANFLGMLGCAEILSEITFEPDYVISAAGTGTTASGLLYNSNNSKIIVVPVLKNGHFIKDEIIKSIEFAGLPEEDIKDKLNLLTIETNYHFGGYGKWTTELIDFMNTFYKETGIPLDQVYTAKMVYAFYEKLKAGFFKSGSKIVLLHTGGLQGLKTLGNLIKY